LSTMFIACLQICEAERTTGALSGALGTTRMHTPNSQST
jgi:hypothetical protein